MYFMGFHWTATNNYNTKYKFGTVRTQKKHDKLSVQITSAAHSLESAVTGQIRVDLATRSSGSDFSVSPTGPQNHRIAESSCVISIYWPIRRLSKDLKFEMLTTRTA